MNAQQYCGTITIIGKPNAGKSTLLNALLGQKVSIVSPKPQTTRTRITGILTQDNVQMIILDTPGLMDPQSRFQRAMVKAAKDSMVGVNVVVHLVDASLKNPFLANKDLLVMLQAAQASVLVLNKIDRIAKHALIKLAQQFNEAFSYGASFMISAKTGDGVQDLQADLLARLPEGDFLYNSDDVTDMPLRLLAAGITREKIFLQLHEELPHACLVQTENWERDDLGRLCISQAILIQRPSQKAIVLGKGGTRIKAIGQAARVDIEEILGEHIFLKLFVKVEKDWPQHSEIYQALGLNFNA